VTKRIVRSEKTLAIVKIRSMGTEDCNYFDGNETGSI